jgi:hypothetical protein
MWNYPFLTFSTSFISDDSYLLINLRVRSSWLKRPRMERKISVEFASQFYDYLVKFAVAVVSYPIQKVMFWYILELLNGRGH